MRISRLKVHNLRGSFLQKDKKIYGIIILSTNKRAIIYIGFKNSKINRSLYFVIKNFSDFK